MNAQLAEITPIVFVQGNAVVTTSLEVCRFFNRRHDNVVQRIRQLDCSPEYHSLNFKEVSYEAKGHNGSVSKYPAYEMTKDGFIFLVMGFIGKKAAAFKEAYIKQFNHMEAQLLVRSMDSISQVPSQTDLMQALFNTSTRFMMWRDHSGRFVLDPLADDEQVVSVGNVANTIKNTMLLSNEQLQELIGICTEKLTYRANRAI